MAIRPATGPPPRRTSRNPPSRNGLQPVRGGQAVDEPVEQEPGETGQHQRGGERRTRRPKVAA